MQLAASSNELERAKGIEPSYAAWEAAVLPLNYARLCPFDYLRPRVPPSALPPVARPLAPDFNQSRIFRMRIFVTVL